MTKAGQKGYQYPRLLCVGGPLHGLRRATNFPSIGAYTRDLDGTTDHVYQLRSWAGRRWWSWKMRGHRCLRAGYKGPKS